MKACQSLCEEESHSSSTNQCNDDNDGPTVIRTHSIARLPESPDRITFNAEDAAADDTASMDDLEKIIAHAPIDHDINLADQLG